MGIKLGTSCTDGSVLNDCINPCSFRQEETWSCIVHLVIFFRNEKTKSRRPRKQTSGSLICDSRNKLFNNNKEQNSRHGLFYQTPQITTHLSQMENFYNLL